MPHCWREKCVHIYTAQNTAWQSEANWSRWPLLNHITGDHISLFIGHKRSTSVSTRLTFPYEIFESGFFTSTPPPPTHTPLFKPAFATYIKPPFFSPLRVLEQIWRQNAAGVSGGLCLPHNTASFKWLVYTARPFNTQLIWQLCKPEPFHAGPGPRRLFLIWSQSSSCVWLLFNCFLSAGSIISPGTFLAGGQNGFFSPLVSPPLTWLNNRNWRMMRSLGDGSMRWRFSMGRYFGLLSGPSWLPGIPFSVLLNGKVGRDKGSLSL